MDALWSVAGQVFTTNELNEWSPAEAFALGASFYIHDLAMSIAATSEGAKQLRESREYQVATAKLVRLGANETAADLLAIEQAARAQHAKRAHDFATLRLPGIGHYLIESTELREQWGHTIGTIASSHHWPLDTVATRLGPKGHVAAAIGGRIDEALVACALRIIDYAHINNERALYIEQCLRKDVPLDSGIHWAAQRDISGPLRDHDTLKFSSLRPIKNLDAWWLFYEMARGLNDEIRAVHSYLDSRSASQGRFSLHGVTGTESPRDFAKLVTPDEFEPIDIRIRPHSMSRLVELLGGRSLYGNDTTVCLRELLQNASDAIRLRYATSADAPLSDGRIEVTTTSDPNGHYLTVKDNGVGMSPTILTEHLLGIASDYWNSDTFAHDFPHAAKSFKPVGRFGIGFLSVFMIADRVDIETERQGGPRLQLRIQDAGQRGALRTTHACGSPGTTIRLKLKQSASEDFKDLQAIVRRHAPMATIPIVVRTSTVDTIVTPGWWRNGSLTTIFSSTTPDALAPNERHARTRLIHEIGLRSSWLHRQNEDDIEVIAEHTDATYRVGAIAGLGNLLVCSQGFAVTPISTPGLIGLVDIEHLELDAARAHALNWNPDQFRNQALEALRPKLLASIDALSSRPNIPNEHERLSKLVDIFGHWILKESTLPWITVIEAPGTSTLLSSHTFRDKIGTFDSIGIAMNSDPWSAPTRIHNRYPKANERVPIVPFAELGGVISSYESKQETVFGPLSSHIRTLRSHRSLSEQTQEESTTIATQSGLLNVVLSLISEAWNISVTELANQDWSRRTHEGNLGVVLTRRSR